MGEVKKASMLRFKQDDGSDFPDWETKTFADVARFINGRAYKQEELLSSGKYLVLRVGNLFSNNEWYYSDLELDEDKYVENGDLMYAWSASFGPHFWKGEKTVYHYHIWKVIPEDLVDKRFLYFVFFNDVDRIKSQSQGGTMFHITKGSIESRKFNLPTLPEQTKIANFLTAVDAKIANLSEEKSLLENYKKGVMQKIFSQELRFKQDDGSNFPECETKRLGECVKSISSGKIKPKQFGSFDLYGSTGVIGKCDTPSHNGEFILIARVGANAGKIHSVSGEFGVTDNTLIIDVSADLNLYYLVDYLNYFNLNRLIYGSGQPLITAGLLKKIKIPLPTKFEQTKIANFLTSIDEKINTVTEAIEKTQEWKKGLLQQLFV